MPDVQPKNAKEEIKRIAAKYGIDVVGFLTLSDRTKIPADEMGLLKGVKWEDGEVDLSNVHDPLDIMPSAKTMIILGKRLFDDRADIYYQVSENYSASVEMMLLEVASSRIVAAVKKGGAQAEEYTSYYLKVWAVLAGLGWIGKSRMFVSKAYGPRLRLRGILTDLDIGEPCDVLPDESCGACVECIRACPVRAITENEVDRKKCGACPVNHRKLTENARAYCTACTMSCPIGKASRQKHGGPPQKRAPATECGAPATEACGASHITPTNNAVSEPIFAFYATPGEGRRQVLSGKYLNPPFKVEELDYFHAYDAIVTC